VVGANDASIDDPWSILERGPRAAQRAATVAASVAQYLSFAFVVTKRHEVQAQYLDLFGLSGRQIFTSNDWIPEIYVHDLIPRLLDGPGRGPLMWT
jgi:hypothetical protein